MRTNATRALWLALIAAMALFAVGCASTGGGDVPAAPEAPAAPDYRDEVGENGLPTPRALIQKYVDAVGGEDAIRAHDSMTMKGKMSLAAMGVEGELVIHAKAPNKFVMNVEMGGMGSMTNGFNGEIGWSTNPMTGAKLLEGAELEQAIQEADFYADLNYAETYPEQETLEETTFADQAAYKVRLVNKAGKESFQYFSKDTSYVIGVEAEQESDMGTANVVTTLSDYQDAGGVMVPMKNVMSVMGMEIVNTVTEVVRGETDDAVFAVPEAIQALQN